MGLVLVIVAVQGYFEQIYKEAVYERVLTVPSELLQDVRNRDAWNLSHYMYGDLDKSSEPRAHTDRQGHADVRRGSGCGQAVLPGQSTAIKKEEPRRGRGTCRRSARWRDTEPQRHRAEPAKK